MARVNPYILWDGVKKTLEDQLSTKEVEKEYIKILSKYVDKNSDIYFTDDLSTRPLFSEKQHDMIFDLLEISRKTIKGLIKETDVIDNNWKVATNPTYVLVTLSMIYFMKKDKKDMAMMFGMYMVYPMYISNHFSIWEHEPDKNIMRYTVEHLSQQFYLRKLGSLNAVLEATLSTAIDTYTKNLKDGTDIHVKDFIGAIYRRIASFVQYIGDKFYDNFRDHKVIMTISDNLTEEDYRVVGNNAYEIQQNAARIVEDISTTRFINEGFVDDAAKLADVSTKKLVNLMRFIGKKPQTDLFIAYERLLQVYLDESKEESLKLGTRKFFIQTQKIYRSSSKNTNLKALKDTLQDWVNDAADHYGQNYISSGKTSSANFKKAIYIALCLKAVDVAKKGR